MPTQHSKLGESTSLHVCCSSKQCHNNSSALSSNTRQHRSNDTRSTLDLGPQKFAPTSSTCLSSSDVNYVNQPITTLLESGNIYINRDLSPIEAKLAYQKRVKLCERLICQNLRSAASNTPDCELMPFVNTTAVGLNDRADIVHATVSDSNTVNQSQSFL